MASYNRLRRCVLTPSLSFSRPRRFHILSNPNFSDSHSSLLRPFPGPFPAKPIFPVIGALFSLGSRSFFTDSVEFSSALATGGELVVAAEQSVFPIRALISMLDGLHHFTGLPWWIVIGTSIFAVRAALLPLLVYQLRKLKRIGELVKILPPPIPLPSSKRSFMDQFKLFEIKRKEIGCPSFLWLFPYVCVQAPCFFLWMTTVRRMSLDQHPGFDCGGAFWFNDLTEFPNGLSGSIFPVVIAGLHYINIQISFRARLANDPASLLDYLIKYYKIYLDVLTLPILLFCYFVPQGTLVYWATNSSLSFIQILLFKSSSVRAKLGLLDPSPASAAESPNANDPGRTNSGDPERPTIHLEDLSLEELVDISRKLLSEQQIEPAIYVLNKVALVRDPEYTSALILMSQILITNGRLAEAIEHLERVISKLTVPGYPLKDEEILHLIVASMWMGTAYVQMGKVKEGIVYFERIGSMKEPDDPITKSQYYDGLLQLSSALHVVGRIDESLKFLRLAAAFNPAYKKFLEERENEDDPTFELASSRRRDY